MAKIVATWYANLYCDCPHCEENVDLLADEDFWDGAFFEIAEHNTPRTRDVIVRCPECGEDIIVDFEW